MPQATNNKNHQQNVSSEDPINLRMLFLKYRNYWKLFVASLAVALLGVFIYKKYVPPTYDIVATLEVQGVEDRNSPANSSLVDFQQLDQVNAPRVVENEINVLRSSKVIKQVVDHFQLWATYTLKGGIIKDQEMYGKNPVKINLLNYNSPVKKQDVTIHLIDDNTYEFTGTNKSLKGTHRFGETINDELGKWNITPNANLKEFIGSDVNIQVADPDLTVLGYQNALVVAAEEKPATIINVSISDKNIQRGQDFINYLIYSYKLIEVAEKNEIAQNTLNFIDARLDSLSGQLNYAENKIEGYRSNNQLADVGAQSQMYLQQVQLNNEKLNEINIQLSIINKLQNYINNPSGSGSVPSTLGLTDPNLQQLVQKLAEVQLERNKLLATLPEKNPAFEPLNNQIATLKLSIKESIASIKSAMQTTQNSLKSYQSGVMSSIKNVPVQEHQLAGMGRQQSNKETLYKYLLQQREQIALTYGSASSNVHVVDDAHILPLKSSKKYMPFGLALVLGLLVPVGFIYSKDLAKNTITNRREIERSTGVPVIAELSTVKLASPIIFSEKLNNDSFILIEQFRLLRTKLVSLHPASQKGVVVLITSSVENEGKSFVSSNLAISLANTSKKVVVLEMDIYKPNISKVFGLKTTPGLSDYLRGKADLKQIIQQHRQYERLSIIPCGEFIDDFSELLDRQGFSGLIEELRSEYEYILLDTPPSHSISDSVTLAKYCDTTLYLVRYDSTSRALMPFIEKLNNESLLPEMHIIFNGLTQERDSDGIKYKKYYQPQN